MDAGKSPIIRLLIDSSRFRSLRVGENWTIIGLISFLSVIIAYFYNQSLKTNELAITLSTPIVRSIEPVYNVAIEPQFRPSPKLQLIVDEIVALAKQQGLPTDKLSITLIDVNSLQVAGYREEELRYPASISKLFWMVLAFDLIDRNVLTQNNWLTTNISNMVRDSDNEAASRILDLITNSKSGESLNRQQLPVWIQKRDRVNRFFQAAGYHDLNLTQKTYPINYLHLEQPEGRDSQMRGFFQHPLRNQISTRHSGRLMYELVKGLAVSPQSSRQMMDLLEINAATRRERLQTPSSVRFNSVLGFLSESLPDDVNFAAKAGWTSDSRQEVANIQSLDGKINYVIAICGEDRAFADNWQFFPQLSLQTFQTMSGNSLNEKNP
jgi:hypothetical protein